MSCSIAPNVLEVNSFSDSRATGVVNRITGLMCALRDAKAHATESDHFRHERQRLKRAIRIKRRTDFFEAADLHDISRA
jgi:hypothetical protein